MKRFYLFVGLILVLAACKPEPRTVVDIVEVLVTATAANTPTATPTILPTSTPPLTAVPAITPSPTAVIAHPHVIRVSPVLRSIDLQERITIYFDEMMDEESVEQAIQISPPVPVTFHWESWEGKILHITIDEILAPSTTYEFTIQKTAVSYQNIPLEEAYTFQKRTKSIVASISAPKENPSDPIIVRFNAPMVESSVESAFTITPAVDGTLTWSDFSRQLTFQPTIALPPGRPYTITLDSPITDQFDNTVTIARSHPFISPESTVAIPSSTSSMRPTDSIRLDFGRAVDHASVEEAFTLRGRTVDTRGCGGGGPITDYEYVLAWEGDSLILTDKDGRFPEFIILFPTIDITAVDIDGISLFSREYVNHIYVAHYADTADFGVGEDIQVVSADSRRAVHYRGFDLGVLDVQFDLYRIPPEKFAERYVAHNWETDSLLLAKSWTEQTREEGDYSLNPQELIIPEDVPAGAYILNLSGDFLNDQLFILLTNHQLTLKKDDEQIAAWVDGSAAADGIVRFYAADGRLLHQEQTGDDGIVTANITAEAPAFVTAQQGTEIVMAKTSWGNTYYNPPAAPLHIHISTERPIYKPGDTVYFKAILRSDDDAHLEPIPEGSAVTVTLYDARGNRVKTAVLNSNDYGTVNGSFLIGEGATVGSYRIEAAFDGTTRDLRFKVEEYRKPEYKVTISTDSHAYLLDDEIIVTVESAYFFGEPLADAEVTLMLYDREWYYDEKELPTGRTVRLDENGRLTTTISAENAGRLLIEAIVDDGSNQTVAAQAVVHIYSSFR